MRAGCGDENLLAVRGNSEFETEAERLSGSKIYIRILGLKADVRDRKDVLAGGDFGQDELALVIRNHGEIERSQLDLCAGNNATRTVRGRSPRWRLYRPGWQIQLQTPCWAE